MSSIFFLYDHLSVGKVINEKVLLSGQYFKKGYIRNVSGGASHF